MAAANSQRVVSWCWNHRGRTRRTRHSCGNGTTRQRERRLIGERSAGTGTPAIGSEREQAAIGLLVEGGSDDAVAVAQETADLLATKARLQRAEIQQHLKAFVVGDFAAAMIARLDLANDDNSAVVGDEHGIGTADESIGSNAEGGGVPAHIGDEDAVLRRVKAKGSTQVAGSGRARTTRREQRAGDGERSQA